MVHNIVRSASWIFLVKESCALVVLSRRPCHLLQIPFSICVSLRKIFVYLERLWSQIWWDLSIVASHLAFPLMLALWSWGMSTLMVWENLDHKVLWMGTYLLSVGMRRSKQTQPSRGSGSIWLVHACNMLWAFPLLFGLPFQFGHPIGGGRLCWRIVAFLLIQRLLSRSLM